MNNSFKYLKCNKGKGSGIGDGCRNRKEILENSQIVNEDLVGKDLENTVSFKGTRSTLIFENLSEWLTTAETATYLRKFSPEGKPSVNAIHKLVSQGKIRRRKFSGRLYFKKNELDYLIETSEA